MGQFPFGAPVLQCGTHMPPHEFGLVMIGAYPSALHVRWMPPPEVGDPVVALPVDNEPHPFWTGQDPPVQEEFEAWHARYFDPAWGQVAPARLNGPTGRAIGPDYLDPLGVKASDVFATDCLPTARASSGVAKRLADRYQTLVDRLGAPAAVLAPHPSETQIVREALAEQADRLADQIDAARSEMILTLGNAAARVLAALGGFPGSGALTAEIYGRPRRVTIKGRDYSWQALVHPAVRAPWRDRHEAWKQSQASARARGLGT